MTLIDQQQFLETPGMHAFLKIPQEILIKWNMARYHLLTSNSSMHHFVMSAN